MAVAEEEDDAEEARGWRGGEEGPGRDGLEPVPDRPQGLCGEQSENLLHVYSQILKTFFCLLEFPFCYSNNPNNKAIYESNSLQ